MPRRLKLWKNFTNSKLVWRFPLGKVGLEVITKANYKFSFPKHQPSGPMLSISWFVHLCVRVFTFEVPFERFFAPTSWSWISNIFRDLKSFGKSSKKKWSQIEFFFGSGLKLPYKTWWKPCIPMDKKPLVKGHIANFGIFLETFEFLRFERFFSV